MTYLTLLAIFLPLISDCRGENCSIGVNSCKHGCCGSICCPSVGAVTAIVISFIIAVVIIVITCTCYLKSGRRKAVIDPRYSKMSTVYTIYGSQPSLTSLLPGEFNPKNTSYSGPHILIDKTTESHGGPDIPAANTYSLDNRSEVSAPIFDQPETSNIKQASRPATYDEIFTPQTIVALENRSTSPPEVAEPPQKS
ncbi:hypothetical protein SNE40_014747 [Patella caerulea]|uniref:Cysteine and tyrosine-rich protein 1 n=1 Tax=Patella caerulea TaxID=87958 RepID=A0AAN8JFA6_PATCE